MGERSTLDQLTISKPALVLSNALFMLLVIFAGHVALVNLYLLGESATLIAAAVSTAAIVAMAVWQREHRFSPLLVGALLWAVLGEMLDQLRFADIVSTSSALVLAPTVVLVVYLVRGERLSDFYAIAIVFFSAIWVSHFALVNLFTQLGKTHPLTFASSSLFLAALVFAGLGIRRSHTHRALTVHSILITCSAWSILEYLWAWEVIPKGW